ncbi:XyeA family cyclophane-containing RiPP triceptide [Photorhabdus asymbiotica]|uniref:XyeA family cyclophane-containing RiPP triceptide n=1 Tax=Photorhabdus asymbiotica TaxID=291112 RepID=UPI003DA6D459
MSSLKREIAATKTEIKGTKVKNNQPQPLTEDLLDQISGGWVNAFAKWTKRI